MRSRFVRTAVAVALLSLLIVGVGPTAGAAGVNAEAIPAAQAGSGTFLLASGRNFPDALSGAILSYAYDAPILLTEADRLPDEVAARIAADGPDRIIILGGEAVIEPAVALELEALGVTTVERLSGPNRFATSAVIAAHAARALQDAGAARIAEVETIVAAAVAVLQSQIDALITRVAMVETDATDLEGRVEALESSGPTDGPLKSIEASITGVTATIWSNSDAAVMITMDVTATVDGVGSVRTSIANSHVYSVVQLPSGGFFDTGAAGLFGGAIQAEVDVPTDSMPGPTETVSADVYLDFFGTDAHVTYAGPLTAYTDMR